ncbi:MAG: DUF5131 family protein [Chthoniobacteraceae bacterium]
MSNNTKIEWCDHTVNFWWGCEKVSPACANCYAEGLSKRFAKGRASWGKDGTRWVRHETARRELYKLDAAALGDGCRRRVFINSMSDTFEDRPDINEARVFLWDACRWVRNLDIILLTKRPENIARMLPTDWGEGWSEHVWLGTTVENQEQADKRILELIEIPAKVRFLSCEPLLGSVDLLLPDTDEWCCAECGSLNVEADNISDDGKWWKCMYCGASELGECATRRAIHRVICGGESGPKARPMHPDWARSLRDQCAAAGVPFFFKQWGEWQPEALWDPQTPWNQVAIKNDGAQISIYEVPEECGAHRMIRIGKKAAGRLLDGKEHNEFPTA